MKDQTKVINKINLQSSNVLINLDNSNKTIGEVRKEEILILKLLNGCLWKEEL